MHTQTRELGKGAVFSLMLGLALKEEGVLEQCLPGGWQGLLSCVMIS